MIMIKYELYMTGFVITFIMIMMLFTNIAILIA